MQKEIVSYSEFVKALCKPGEEILRELTPGDCHLLHMAIGVAGEGGELLDAAKRAVIYRKPLDVANVVEELGDLEFFMEGVRGALGISREHVIAANRAKLSERYKKLTYSNEAAQARADKAPAGVGEELLTCPVCGGNFLTCGHAFPEALRAKNESAKRERVQAIKAEEETPHLPKYFRKCKECGEEWTACPHSAEFELIKMSAPGIPVNPATGELLPCQKCGAVVAMNCSIPGCPHKV